MLKERVSIFPSSSKTRLYIQLVAYKVQSLISLLNSYSCNKGNNVNVLFMVKSFPSYANIFA